jgi:menaquinone-dependent protoporphyrinogen oxidase
MTMRILVAFASRHGATRGIAERIAQSLQARGHDVTLTPAEQVSDISDYDGFVIGSAAYNGRWLTEATRLVRQHRDLLARRPVWLFSSGPVGTELVDAKGRDVVEASRPAEFAEFAESIHPRDERIFFGAYDPDAEPVGAVERFGAWFMRIPAIRKALPAGDFRDWPQIESWADGIALELEASRSPAAALA